MSYGRRTSIYAWIKRIISVPSTQVTTSFLIVIATIVLAASTTIGTNYLSASDAVDINQAQVKSTTASRDIGEAIDLSRIPTDSTSATSVPESNSNSHSPITTSEKETADSSSDISSISTPIKSTDTTSTLPVSEKSITTFSFSSYKNSDDEHTIIFSWETKAISEPHRLIVKKTTNRIITDDDVQLLFYDNTTLSNFSDAFTYNDLGNETLYLELQVLNELGVWVAIEHSDLSFE